MLKFYHFRAGEARDLNEVMDMDIKYFEHPHAGSEWLAMSQDRKYALAVATNFGNVIGFALIRVAPTRMMELVKIAVKPLHRRQKIASRLVLEAVKHARKLGFTHLMTVVPEHMIYPGDRYLVPWLKTVGFKGEKPFLTNYFEACGDHEDGVRFTMEVK